MSTYVGNVPRYSDNPIYTGTGDGSTVAYTLTWTPPTQNGIEVFLGSVIQRPTTDYSVSGTTLTFTSAPPNGVAILVYALTKTGMASTPAAGSVVDGSFAAGVTGSGGAIVKATSPTITTPTINGVTDASSAGAGVVGQYLEQTVSFGSVPATATWGDATASPLALTAGDWDVSAVVLISANGGGGMSGQVECGISSTSGASSSGLTFGVNRASAIAPTATLDGYMSIPCYRVSLSGATNYYLKINCTYSSGTPKVYGRISARRVR